MSTQPGIQPPTDQPDSTTRWHRVEVLFHRASELPAGERTAFLERACADHPDDLSLLPELLDLLESDADVAQKVDSRKSPAAAAAAAADERTFTDSWLHRTLGHYLVEHELGRGGMGVVYLGRRTTPGPHQQAAIKVVRRNLQESPALNHFLLERDALARLEHPNIARLLDGGVTNEGIPWLALEYVEGRRLDQYVDQYVDQHVKNLADADGVPGGHPVQTILGLLIQLCAAVGYVHRNLILHRDLKPGNVMVTPEGVVKLLDFGTLKILQTDEDSAMTQAGMRPITLRYASPEHVHGHRVSTASDVYSLGIILYRLLAGRFPERSPNGTAAAPTDTSPQNPFHSPMAAFFDDLRDDRLALPSAFTSLAMPHELACDLDAIIIKAIRHNPQDRYQTAEALSAELTRALENRPVAARGNNRAYLARKFYTRHAVALWTATAACLILFAALVVMAHETRIARVQQANAEMGVAQERKLAKLLLFDITPRVELISTTPGQKEIVARVSAYLDRLNTGSNPDPELQLYQIQGYNALSNILGNPSEANLGDSRGAILEAKKAIALAEPLLRQRPDDLTVLEAQLGNELLLGYIYLGNGDLPQATLSFANAEAFEPSILAHQGLAAKDVYMLATLEDAIARLNWGAGRATLGREDVSVQHALRSIEFNKQVLALNPHAIRSILGLFSTYYQLGTINEDTHPEVAIKYFQSGLDEAAHLSPEELQLPRSRRFQRILNDNLGATMTDVGRIDEGLARLAMSRDLSHSTLLKDPMNEATRSELVLVDLNFSAVFVKINRPAEAIPIIQEAIALSRQSLERHASDELLLKKALGLLYLDIAASDTDQPALAGPARSEGLPILLGLASKPEAGTAICLFAAHQLDRVGGDPNQALAFARRAMLASNPGPDEYIELAIAELRTGSSEAALADARKASVLLIGTTGGYNKFRKEEVSRIMHQPMPPLDPEDHGPVYRGQSAFPKLTAAPGNPAAAKPRGPADQSAHTRL